MFSKTDLPLPQKKHGSSFNVFIPRCIFFHSADEPPEDNNSTEPLPPEEVIVDSEVVAEESSNLTISCKHPHNGTIYQVILEKMLHSHPWVIIGICKKVEGGLVGEDYSERGRVNCADNLDLSLHLTDVASGDDGLYRCTFNTDVGVQTTVVQLRTAPPGTLSNTPDVKSATQTDAVSFPMIIAICTSMLQHT